MVVQFYAPPSKPSKTLDDNPTLRSYNNEVTMHPPRFSGYMFPTLIIGESENIDSCVQHGDYHLR